LHLLSNTHFAFLSSFLSTPGAACPFDFIDPLGAVSADCAINIVNTICARGAATTGSVSANGDVGDGHTRGPQPPGK
jgi:hypothetical protein